MYKGCGPIKEAPAIEVSSPAKANGIEFQRNTPNERQGRVTSAIRRTDSKLQKTHLASSRLIEEEEVLWYYEAKMEYTNFSCLYSI